MYWRALFGVACKLAYLGSWYTWLCPLILIIWSYEAVCPYGSRVCHGLPNRLWVAWVSRFKCRYSDTQSWQRYCFLNNWHDTLSEAVGDKQILGVHLYNLANISFGIKTFLWNIGLCHCMAVWSRVFPCVACGRQFEHKPAVYAQTILLHIPVDILYTPRCSLLSIYTSFYAFDVTGILIQDKQVADFPR